MSLFFCFLGVNIGWDTNSLSARMLHLLHQFVPDEFAFWSRVEGRGSRVEGRGSRVEGNWSRVEGN